MPVFKGSRYSFSRLLRVRDDRVSEDGPVRDFLYTHDRLRSDVPIAEVYTTVEGDRLDRLAYRYARDSTLWWVLAEVNNIFGFPLFLRPGTKLRIPTSEVFRKAASGER